MTPLDPSRLSGLLSLCALDPVVGVSLAHQVLRWPSWARGDVVADDVWQPNVAAWATGSLMPLGLAARPELGHPGAGPDAARVLADHASRRLTSHGSVYGYAEDVAAVWEHLAGGGMQAREERWEQPLLVAPRNPGGTLAAKVLDRRPGLAWAAAGVHRAASAEEALVLPASVAMFTGELGYDPTEAGSSYARHVNWLVASGRSYVLLDDGAGAVPGPNGPRAVAFKTDVGALWSAPGGAVAQLTGVWTRPDLRGRGIGSVALAAVVDAVRRDHVGADGVISLYVNSFNAAALGLYAGLGFNRVGTFATVLL
ncbi:GNAT family N-acetyltransferase [Actinomyces sp.]|uniref:GNAT family N-acetyltransferase n=1 Tax=Actinomyces sp. TaxID=29317 RepID=UPI0026DC54A4|nr:GNAT family N-acetyltransferase [Actinomyces sp.]MDO4899888.1 GNAT family N-acetyltransferase [Actinomyces sp.]